MRSDPGDCGSRLNFTNVTPIAADRSRRTIPEISDRDYYGAPQVFYFAPHREWYLTCQMNAPGAKFMA